MSSIQRDYRSSHYGTFQSNQAQQEIYDSLKIFCHHNLNSYFDLRDGENLVLENSNFNLEGWNLLSFSEYLIKDLDDFINCYRKDLNKSEFQKLEKAITCIEESVCLLRKPEKKRGEYTYKKVDRLQVGESFLVEGGFRGHSMLYEVECIEIINNKKVFNFSIINAGKGSSSYHKQDRDKVYRLVAKHLSVEDLNKAFWCQLDSFRLSSKSNKDQVYQFLKESFKGNLTADKHLLPHKRQEIGICVSKSVHFWLSDFLQDNRLYGCIKVYRTARSIERLEKLSQNKSRFFFRRDTTQRDPNRREVSITQLLTRGYLCLEKRSFKVLSKLEESDPLYTRIAKLKESAVRKLDSYMHLVCEAAIESREEGIFRILRSKTKEVQADMLQRAARCNSSWMVREILKLGQVSDGDKENTLITAVRELKEPSRISQMLLENTQINPLVRNRVFTTAVLKADFRTAELLFDRDVIEVHRREKALKVGGKELIKKILGI